ncbi:trans-sialidase, partial [Trypanosoma rangeli SC58]
MGVKMNDEGNSVLFGLSYTKDKKWSFKLGSADSTGPSGTWEPNTQYQVVLQMDWDDWFVYVGGNNIYTKKYDGALFKSGRISHFFFGVDDKSTDEAN